MTPNMVLLVDDDDAIAGMLREALAETGCGLVIATNPAEAWDELRQRVGRFCLVITEIEPRAEAMVLIDAIKTCCRDLPVVVLTGLGDWDLYAKAMARGAAAFLTKPTDRPELRALLTRICPDTTELTLVNWRN